MSSVLILLSLSIGYSMAAAPTVFIKSSFYQDLTGCTGISTSGQYIQNEVCMIFGSSSHRATLMNGSTILHYCAYYSAGDCTGPSSCFDYQQHTCLVGGKYEWPIYPQNIWIRDMQQNACSSGTTAQDTFIPVNVCSSNAGSSNVLYTVVSATQVHRCYYLNSDTGCAGPYTDGCGTITLNQCNGPEKVALVYPDAPINTASPTPNPNTGGNGGLTGTQNQVGSTATSAGLKSIRAPFILIVALILSLVSFLH